MIDGVTTGAIMGLDGRPLSGGAGGGSRPAYIEDSFDALMTEGGAVDWTTDEADSESGTVTTWPSEKGEFGDVTPTDQSGSADVRRSNYGKRFINGQTTIDVGSANVPVLGATPIGFLMVFRRRVASFIRLVENAASGNKISIAASGTISIEKAGSGTWATFAAPALADNANAGSMVEDTWHVLGFRWSNVAGDFEAWLDGVKLTAATNAWPNGATWPTPHRSGATNIFEDFDFGDWVFYVDPSDAEMSAHTSQAKNRWNAPATLATAGTVGERLSAIRGIQAVFIADECDIAQDTGNATPADTIGDGVRYLEDLSGNGNHWTSETTSADAGEVVADGIAAGADSPATRLSTPDMDADEIDLVFGFLYKTPAADAGNRGPHFGNLWANQSIYLEVTGASSPFDQNKVILRNRTIDQDIVHVSGTSDFHVVTVVSGRGRIEIRINGVSKGIFAPSGFPTVKKFKTWDNQFAFLGTIAGMAYANSMDAALELEAYLMDKRDELNA